MTTLIIFVFFVLHLLLQALIWLVIASVIVSWLVAFEVINMRNRFAYNVVHMINRATQPLLLPFRRIIPPLGGLDITPMILVILVIATDAILLPALEGWLISLVTPAATPV